MVTTRPVILAVNTRDQSLLISSTVAVVGNTTFPEVHDDPVYQSAKVLGTKFCSLHAVGTALTLDVAAYVG
jgi:hypothetical protein